MLKVLYKLGELNPQFLREFKGRFQTRNILLALCISLIGQFIFFIYSQTLLPQNYSSLDKYTHRYCTGPFALDNSLPECLFDNYDRIIINWKLWSQDAFTSLSIIGIFVLLVGGTYLLINDLATEQRRGTLNFIRLSPQTPQSILLGKMLGVPIILYMIVLLAVPSHLWLGFHAQISLIQVLSFDAVLIGASFLYYSVALLFSLIGSWLLGFQAWLGSGFVLGFLLFIQEAFKADSLVSEPFVAFRFLAPQYFIPDTAIASHFIGFSWFGIGLGNSFLLTVGFTLLIYAVGSYFLWQSLERCYLDPNATILSKRQSYLLTSAFTVMTVGFFNWGNWIFHNNNYHNFDDNVSILMFFDFFLFLYLITGLTNNTQTLYDWSRYQHIYQAKHPGKSKLIKDLIFGEKSINIVAIAINGLIAVTGLTVLITLAGVPTKEKFMAVIAVIFALSLAIIYAALVQLVLFMGNSYSSLWASGILYGAIFLPPVVLLIFVSNLERYTTPWLFSILAPLLVLYKDNLDPISIFLGMVGHAILLSLLLLQINRQVQKIGASATKVLLAGETNN